MLALTDNTSEFASPIVVLAPFTKTASAAAISTWSEDIVTFAPDTLKSGTLMSTNVALSISTVAELMSNSGPLIATLVDELKSVIALSTSTSALISTGVLSMFVPASDWNVVAELLITTTSAPILRSAAASVILTLAVNTVLASTFNSAPAEPPMCVLVASI